MLNEIEKFNLKEMAEQYMTESRGDHNYPTDSEKDEAKCLGCRKMKLGLEMLAFIQDFDKEEVLDTKTQPEYEWDGGDLPFQDADGNWGA
tara:strand:+ start:176 stop:445 length:270 start_codon:yes stop_codon:yes gene_type:complete